MALADTARLIASLELQDKFSGTAGKATRSLGNIEGSLQRGTRQMGIFGHATATALGIGLQRAVSGGVRLISGAISGGVASLNELESVTTASNTVIASTKGIAGQTAAGVRALSEEYENLNATVDDKVIQSGANLLLTFTNIRDKAFEPALEAALNMNEALGGGPEGLQTTILQVGKALNDPIRGVGALRKAGVQLSAQQEAQIKTLIEQNDLYGAQQIVLDELTTQFGGRFAAAGKDAEGRQAALVDRTEDLQKALAGPLMPAIDRARENLITLFESPAAIAASTKLGDTIAGLFTQTNLTAGIGVIEGGLENLSKFDFDQVGDGVQKVFGFMAEVPWDAIGSGLQITGRATKTVVDAFLSLPKEVQGVLIAGLAVNKLSGGLAGAGLKALLGGGFDLFKGRGTTPMNALWVQSVGGGPGGPVGPGGWIGALLAGLKTGVAVASPLLAAAAAVEVVNFMDMREQAIAGLEGKLDALDRTTRAATERSIAAIQGQIDQERPLLEGILFNTNVKPVLERELAELQSINGDQRTGPRVPGTASFSAPGAQRSNTASYQAEDRRLNAFLTRTYQAEDRRPTAVLPDTAMAPVTTGLGSLSTKVSALPPILSSQLSRTTEALAAARSGNAILAQVRDKPSTVNVTVPVTVSVGVGEIQYRVQSLRTTVGGRDSGLRPV